MPALFFAFITYFSWGIGDIFGTIATRKIGGYNNTFYVTAIGFSLSTLYVPFALTDLDKFTPLSLFISIMLAILEPAILILFYEGLRKGNAAIVGTVASSFFAVSILLSILFLGESISPSQTIFIIIIFLGIILSSFNFKQLKNKNILLDPGVPYAVAAMILWGIYFTFIKIPVKEVGWFWPGYISLVTFPLVLVFMKFKGLKLVKPSRKIFISLVLSALLIYIGGFSYNLAISRGLVAVVAPIAGSAATLFALLAFLVFKDPITRQQIAGIIITLIGIVLLSVFSV